MGGSVQEPTPPNSDDLSDRQLADTFTHEALAVRDAVLKNTAVRKRLLAMILHEKVHSELAVRHDANAVTLHASGKDFSSTVFDALREKRMKLDPFQQEYFCEARQASSKLDALIDLLIVDCITAHMQRRTELVHHLATGLKVNVRDNWRPDAAWLSGFQKIQLAHLIAELKGPAHAPAPERRKSELIEVLAKLFADAVDGKLENEQLAKRVNSWLPSNLRAVPPQQGENASETTS